MEQQNNQPDKMDKLPFLISIPHGGTRIPKELRDHVCITEQDLFDDSDSFTREIYDVSGNVDSLVVFDIARAFVDVSRAQDMLPPEFTDGVVKSATCYNRPIYKAGLHPDDVMIQRLLDNYYKPYHASIKAALGKTNVRIALDCHSMADIAPHISPDTGKRPLINLGNAEGKACPSLITSLLRESFIEVFGLKENDVVINQPFKGGYITRTYGNKPKPWIQIEMNRRLYLSGKWFNHKTLKIDNKRLLELNKCFASVLKIFYRKLKAGGSLFMALLILF